MTPEQKSRQEIDQQLHECGWLVQDYRDMNISAALGVSCQTFLGPIRLHHTCSGFDSPIQFLSP